MTYDAVHTVLLVVVTVLTTCVAMMTAAAVSVAQRIERAVRGQRVRDETARPPLAFGERYGCSGWMSGDDCDPPEPGKEWIVIGPVDAYGNVTDEVAVVVHRDVSKTLSPSADSLIRAGKKQAARVIVAALNGETPT